MLLGNTCACVVLSTLLVSVSSNIDRPTDADLYYGTFPENFMWSSATAAYQIEGAADKDGRGDSVWDTFCRIPGKIADGSSGDVACDSYHQYEEDVQLLKEMKVSAYRFSIAWPRIFPNGYGTVNQKGIDYYKAVIAALKREGIEPVVTLFHWDLPQALEDIGGWQNESLIEYFAEYARICYQQFGNDVKYWVTFNEPWVTAWLSYGTAGKAPGLNDPGYAPYTVGHTIIKAHARAYHIYHEEFKAQNGKIGMSYNVGWKVPRNPNSPKDIGAAERAMQFDMGWFIHPTHINGDYPEVMKTQIARKSMQQNLTQSRLPEFTEEEKAYNNGTNDYLGLNFYTSGVVWHHENEPGAPNFWTDQDIGASGNDNWLPSGSTWLAVTPFGIRETLRWMKRSYGDIGILITENGVSDRNGSLDDQHRIYYYKHYINNVLKAIDFDDVNVIGYTAWSLLDNFEWEQGYIERFGLHYVNFTDPARPRIPKASARYYKKIIEDNGFKDPSAVTPTSGPTNGPVCGAASLQTFWGVVSLFMAVGIFLK